MKFNLNVLTNRLDLDLAKLVALADAASAKPPDERNALSEYCLVQLQDSWSRFIRDLIFRSVRGNATRSNGVALMPGAHGYLSQQRAYAILRASWSTRRMNAGWEPAWTSQDDANKAIDILRPTNENDLKAAIGASANPIKELKPVRNFSAHRGPESAKKLKATALARTSSWSQPGDLVLRASGLFVFEQWCKRFHVVAHAAVM